MPLLLQRIIRRRRSFHLHGIGLDLKRLLRLRRRNKRSRHDHRRAYIQLGDLCKIIHLVVVYDLQRFKKCPVIQHDKSKCLGIPDAAHPAPYRNLLIQILFFALV